MIGPNFDPVPTVSGASFAVDNAGLVLAAPFLEHLFLQRDLLVEGAGFAKDWRNRAAYARAVFLTQYLVTGSKDISHADLALNKVMCGGEPGDVVVEDFEPEAAETELCESLLEIMLANWGPLSSGTSVDGLRDAFLQRSGVLSRGENGWTLTVKRQTLDILIEQIGWGFRFLSLPWQSQPIHVEW